MGRNTSSGKKNLHCTGSPLPQSLNRSYHATQYLIYRKVDGPLGDGRMHPSGSSIVHKGNIGTVDVLVLFCCTLVTRVSWRVLMFHSRMWV